MMNVDDHQMTFEPFSRIKYEVKYFLKQHLTAAISPQLEFVNSFSILNDLLSLFFFQSMSHPLRLCLSALQFYISVAVMAGLSFASVALVPPPHLPDLFPVLVSTTAFLHFFGTFLYFNVVQFSGPPSRKSQKKKNWMVPKGSDPHCLLWMCMKAITRAIMSQVQKEQMYNCNNELMERKWIGDHFEKEFMVFKVIFGDGASCLNMTIPCFFPALLALQ